MRSHFVFVLALLMLAGCGASAGGGATPQGGRSEGPPPGASNDNVPPSLASTTAGGEDSTALFGPGSAATGEILVTGPGFTPSPIRVTGVAGGPVDGDASGSGCTGFFPTAPQHVLKISRRVPQLRVMVDGVDRDLTLAIHLPNGQWLCNDDAEDPRWGLNPAIDMTDAGPGEFDVFVGTFSPSDDTPPYSLGVTEDMSRYGSSMRTGASPGGPLGGPSPTMPF